MKKINKSILFCLLLGFTIFTVFKPISRNLVVEEPKTSQPVIVKFWYTENDDEQVALLEKVADFEALNPDIDVQPVQVGYFDAGDQYYAAFATGEEPEVFRANPHLVLDLAKDEMIKALTDEFSIADLNDFLEASINAVTYNGEIWGFPQTVECPVYWYNKNLFNQSGFNTDLLNWSTSWTWPEFMTNIAIINASTSAYATSLPGMFFGAQPYYYGQGAYFIETAENPVYDTAHIAINNTKSRAALDFLKILVDGPFTPPWALQGWPNFVPDFGTGKVAMIATGPWEINNLITNYDQFNGVVHGPENLGFMQLPHDADGNYGSLLLGNYYVISSNITTEQYNASVQLTKFLSAHKQMVKSAIVDNHVPARKSVMTNATFMAAPSYPYIKPFFEQAKNAYPLISSPYYDLLETAFAMRTDEYLNGDTDLDTYVELIIQDWYGILPGPPGNFTLSSNADPPDTDGDFDLIWTTSAGADNYSVYLYDHYITEINGSLTILANKTATSPFPLSDYSNGTYYFVVVAYNDIGFTLSDCIQVIVQLPPPKPPESFLLSTNADPPDTDGNFDLIWSASAGADEYSVYVYDHYITEINGSLTILANKTATSPFPLSEYPNGDYYFVVVASNEYGETMSNVIHIKVQLTEEPSDQKINGYTVLLIIFVPIILIILLIKRHAPNLKR